MPLYILVDRYYDKNVIYWGIFSGIVGFLFPSMYNNCRQTFFLLTNTDDQTKEIKREASVLLRWGKKKMHRHPHSCTHKDLFYES